MVMFICASNRVFKVIYKYTWITLGHVFLSYSGQQMQSGAVSKQMNDKLIEAKIFGDGKIPPKNITVSIIQKSATTGTRMAGFNCEKEMAVLMAHDVSMANKHYDIAVKQATAVKGSRAVSSYFDGKSLPRTPSKFKWTEDLETLLKERFSDNIKNRTICIKDVKERKHLLSHYPFLQHHRKILSRI